MWGTGTKSTRAEVAQPCTHTCRQRNTAGLSCPAQSSWITIPSTLEHGTLQLHSPWSLHRWGKCHCQALLTWQDSFFSRSWEQRSSAHHCSSASGCFYWQGFCPSPGVSPGRCPSLYPGEEDPNTEFFQTGAVLPSSPSSPAFFQPRALPGWAVLWQRCGCIPHGAFTPRRGSRVPHPPYPVARGRGGGGSGRGHPARLSPDRKVTEHRKTLSVARSLRAGSGCCSPRRSQRRLGWSCCHAQEFVPAQPHVRRSRENSDVGVDAGGWHGLRLFNYWQLINR